MNIFKNITGALLGFVLALGVLAACGSETVIREVQVTSETPKADRDETPDLSRADMEEIFTQAIIDEYPEYRGLENDLIEAGYRLCRAADNGADAEYYYRDQLQGSMDAETYGYILGAAISALCPEHEAVMDEIIEGTSNGI